MHLSSKYYTETAITYHPKIFLTLAKNNNSVKSEILDCRSLKYSSCSEREWNNLTLFKSIFSFSIIPRISLERNCSVTLKKCGN